METNESQGETKRVVRLKIQDSIVRVRGQRVIIDADLASLYGTKTKRLKEQVRRNANRFPPDFMFQLTAAEASEVVAVCDHLKKLKYSRVLPLAFTEHGAVMAANILNSPIAIDASILVVRASVLAREILAEHLELKRRLDALESRIARGFHDNEEELQAIRYAIHQLMEPEKKRGKKPLGFGREA
jgi:hypothetical protein